jgi:ribosomal protein S18 acetylase RimI-like enzyme
VSGKIEICPVAPDDVEAIAKLAREIWQLAYLDMVGQAQIDYMLGERYGAGRMREELARPDIWWRQIWVDGERAGFYACQLRQTQGEVKLDKLYVHPGHQRRGLGGLLIAHAGNLARSQGCHTLMLAVNKKNENAIAAYIKYGFTIRESVCVDIGGGFVMDDYLMAKSLGNRG